MEQTLLTLGQVTGLAVLDVLIQLTVPCEHLYLEKEEECMAGPKSQRTTDLGLRPPCQMLVRLAVPNLLNVDS